MVILTIIATVDTIIVMFRMFHVNLWGEQELDDEFMVVWDGYPVPRWQEFHM